MFLFPKINIYFRKDPSYSITALSQEALANSPFLSTWILAQDGNLPKECNYAIEKSLNWIVREMLWSLSKQARCECKVMRLVFTFL